MVERTRIGLVRSCLAWRLGDMDYALRLRAELPRPYPHAIACLLVVNEKEEAPLIAGLCVIQR